MNLNAIYRKVQENFGCTHKVIKQTRTSKDPLFERIDDKCHHPHIAKYFINLCDEIGVMNGDAESAVQI